MRYPFLDLSRPEMPWNDRLKQVAAEVIDSGIYLHGPHTQALQREVALTCYAGRAIGVSNGLDALRLIFRAYIDLGRLKPGDHVIVPANTYIATVLPLTEFGLVPVMAEPDPSTHNIDFSRLNDLISDKVKAIVVVHLYGTPAWDSEILGVAHERGILVVEDNAQAIGARAAQPGFNGTYMTGGLGDAAAISFYPTKNIGALGDGGAVVTSDHLLADRVNILANYGTDRRYHNVTTGYNCRLDEIQAAFLRVKLDYLDAIIKNRNEAASAYDKAITNPVIGTPSILPDCRQVWHQYVITTPYRAQFMEYMKQSGIGTDIHYAVPPHLQPCYADTLGGTHLPVAEALANSVVSLPIAGISPQDAAEIANTINSFIP